MVVRGAGASKDIRRRFVTYTDSVQKAGSQQQQQYHHHTPQETTRRNNESVCRGHTPRTPEA